MSTMAMESTGSNKLAVIGKMEPPGNEEILVFLEKFGYIVVLQRSYQERCLVNDQVVALPYTNSDCEVLLKKIDGTWHYVTRWFKGSDDSFALRVVYGFVQRMTANVVISGLTGWRREVFKAIKMIPGENCIKPKLDVYGEGNLWTPITAPCVLIISVHIENKSWCEVARLYV